MSSTTFGPKRPNAIATLLTTDDFLPGVQTLLHSLEETLPSEKHYKNSPNEYPPERIVLVTPNISQNVREALYPAFCTRIIQVDPIAIPSSKENESHVSSWSHLCGYTKLHMFHQVVYDKLLYIDSDCLVQKDVSHLFQIQKCNELGLLAAAPDVFPPDKFNAGVMLLQPSAKVFQSLLSKAQQLMTYDGGDTGFLNAYFDTWNEYPKENRLGFAYNAQRFLHQCTYEKQPKYWDIAVGDKYIVHYSSSPKPWESCTSSTMKDIASDHLTREELEKVKLAESKSKALDKLWKKCYNRSMQFKEDFEERQKLKKQRKVVATKPKPVVKPAATAAASSGPSAKVKGALTFNKRYKQLKKEGHDSKTAMAMARREFGMDSNDNVSAGKQVAAMFGMPL